jgi:hypothetical protein
MNEQIEQPGKIRATIEQRRRLLTLRMIHRLRLSGIALQELGLSFNETTIAFSNMAAAAKLLPPLPLHLLPWHRRFWLRFWHGISE